MGRKIKSRSQEFIGVDQKVWLGLETGGYGSDATGGFLPVDAGAVDFITMSTKFDIPREDSASRSGRSVIARLSGKKTVDVTVESMIIPADPNASLEPQLPPMHPLMLSAFGEVDVTNPAEIIYKLSRFNSNSARILEESTHYGRLVTGVIMDKLSFSLPGDGKAGMSMEGFGQNAFIAGCSTLDQNITGAEQLATVTIQDLTHTAKVGSGSTGNLINLTYSGGGTAGLEVVTVVGNDIDVQIQDGVSDADDIKTAIDGDIPAAALIDVTVSGVGITAQNIVTQTFLTGGLADDELKVELDHGVRFELGAYIDTILFSDGDTIVDQALKILAIGSGVNQDIIQVDAVLSAATAGDYVYGHAPETYLPLTSENALLGLNGSFTVAGLATNDCELISADISLTNNYTRKDFLYGTDEICGFIPDKRREVTVNINVLLTKDSFSFYMRNKCFIAEEITLTLEPHQEACDTSFSTQGRIFEFYFPKVEFNIPSIENPADSYVTLALEGKALAPSGNQLDEEFVLTIK